MVGKQGFDIHKTEDTKEKLEVSVGVPKKVDMVYIPLSKGCNIYGANSSHGMKTFVCSRCSAIVVDKGTHAIWHAKIENLEITKTIERSNY